jgi:hypothetical protein
MHYSSAQLVAKWLKVQHGSFKPREKTAIQCRQRLLTPRRWDAYHLARNHAIDYQLYHLPHRLVAPTALPTAWMPIARRCALAHPIIPHQKPHSPAPSNSLAAASHPAGACFSFPLRPPPLQWRPEHSTSQPSNHHNMNCHTTPAAL